MRRCGIIASIRRSPSPAAGPTARTTKPLSSRRTGPLSAMLSAIAGSRATGGCGPGPPLWLSSSVRELLPALVEAGRQGPAGRPGTQALYPPATPCQRLLDGPRVPAEVKAHLAELFVTLDPIRLLQQIREGQARLVDLADAPVTPVSSSDPATLDQFLKGLRTAWKEGEVRPTARRKPPVPRGRRRPDPLAVVTADLQDWFKAEPWRTGRELLDKLQ